VGAFKIDLDLKPGQEETLIVTLGVAKVRGEELPMLSKYRNGADVQQALANLREYWEENLSKFQTKTPDEDVNTMINIWNQYQCRTTFNWSRSASYYESGIGRGMGFRDSCQDTLGFVHMIPQDVRQRLFDIASTQFKRGDAYHQYSPLTKKGNGGGFSDDHLWLIMGVAQYLKETGDFQFLREHVPYNCGDEGNGPMYEHLDAAIEFTRNHLGPHGLPRMFNADWNDCLNLWGTQVNSESVWVGMQFVLSCKEMQEIARRSGNEADVEKFKRYETDMTKILNTVAWDGAWYTRAYTDKKEVVGSVKNDEGKIYLLPQAWAVMADIAPRERLVTAMDSLRKHLVTEHGVMLMTPPYTKFNPDLGSITMYPAGLKENGAIFSHPNPWAMLAEALLGRGDHAFEYYKAILPAAKNSIADLRKTEPYVYCQMIAGKHHKDFGEGKNSWLTGTATWNCFAGTSYVLGVRASYDGLVVSPAIPSTWK
jgi:cellobiose phosphorylase